MRMEPELVQHIADLSRLELGREEARAMAAELERVLTYMEVLDRLDTEGAGPEGRFPVENVLREDKPSPSLDRDGLLAGAPASDGEAFLVPRTVE